MTRHRRRLRPGPRRGPRRVRRVPHRRRSLAGRDRRPGRRRSPAPAPTCSSSACRSPTRSPTGPVLQRAASRALAAGTTLADASSRSRGASAAETDLALVLFSYLNPILRHGVGRGRRGGARDAGFDGVLLTDLPPGGGAPGPAACCARAGLDTIFLVSPTSPPLAHGRGRAALERVSLRRLARGNDGRARRALADDLAAHRRGARGARAAKLPVAIGFGIADARGGLARRRALADGVVVGSALVRAAEEAGPRRDAAVEALARSLAAACRREPSGR